MKTLKLDLRRGYAKLAPENYNDLWALSIIIKPGDIVGMKTTRKVKIDFGDRTEAERKPMFLKIRVRDVNFHPFTSFLRASGEIIEGPEDVKGSHTFLIEPGSFVEIWKSFGPEEIEIIRESATQQPDFCIVLVDRERALVFYRNRKIWVESHLPPKGEEEENALKEFFGRVKKAVEEFSPKFTIVAGPGFIKEKLAKFLETPFIESVSYVNEAGLRELFARGAVSRIAGKVREEEEEKAVNRIFEEIARGGKVFYGEEEAKKFAEEGNVKFLVISASFIGEKAREGRYRDIKEIMEKVKYSKGKILVVGMNRDAENRLKGLGGIAGLRRW